MRFASAALNTTAAQTITPNSATSATERPRWSRQRAGPRRPAGGAADGAAGRRRRRQLGWPTAPRRRRRRRRELRHPRIVRVRAGVVASPGSTRSFTWPCARLDAMPPEKLSWKHLYDEVVTSGLCTGCAGCVIACPHDVLGYDDTNGVYKPLQIEDVGGPGDCSHGEKGCTSCTRACPRFRAWEPEIDEFLFGRARDDRRAVAASSRTSCLARAADPELHEVGQDGGLVSAMLVYALEHDIIDAALVSYLEGDGTTWKAIPGIARTREDVIASAGSRYTYSANTLAYMDLDEGRRAHRARRHVVPVVDPAGDEAAQGGQGRAPAHAQHRPAVLEDVRRRDLRGALRGEVRPEEERHQEDEHQGRVPDLDEQRRLPRGAAEGVPRRGRARAARCAPTSRPSTPTSPPAASASSTTGRSRSCAPTPAASSWTDACATA